MKLKEGVSIWVTVLEYYKLYYPTTPHLTENVPIAPGIKKGKLWERRI